MLAQATALLEQPEVYAAMAHADDVPTEVIDFVITRRGTNQPRATGMHVTVGSVASDHCPLSVDVEY